MSPTTTTADTGTPGTKQCAPAGVRTVVCYARTANPGTVGQRHLQRQRAKLHAACAAQGWTVLECVEDLHQSGTTLNRPGLHRALALLADHYADALLATDATHLAVDAAVISQLASLAARQSWQLLTLTPTWTSTTVSAAVVDSGLDRSGAHR